VFDSVITLSGGVGQASAISLPLVAELNDDEGTLTPKLTIGVMDEKEAIEQSLSNGHVSDCRPTTPKARCESGEPSASCCGACWRERARVFGDTTE